MPEQVAAQVHVGEVCAHALLRPGGAAVQHPGGGVDARLQPRDPRDGLEVVHQVRGLPPQGPKVDAVAPALQQQQLIEGLQ